MKMLIRKEKYFTKVNFKMIFTYRTDIHDSGPPERKIQNVI